MNIVEIYKKYKNTPQLIQHQLRVAGVASLICDNIQSDVNKQDIVAACLLHDIGNIIKFDFSKTAKLYPNAYSPEDLTYWQKVKEEFIAKYGNDEHQASIEIAKELGVGNKAVDLIDCISFHTGKVNAESADYGRKICAYSDMRVGPNGVISLEERFADLRIRYEAKRRQVGGGERQRQEFENGLRQIEKQLFAHSSITPAGINDKTIAPWVLKLRGFEI